MDISYSATGVVHIGDDPSSNKIETIKGRIQKETLRVKNRAAQSSAKKKSTTSRDDKRSSKVATKKVKQHAIEFLDEETKEERVVVEFQNEATSLQQMAKRIQQEHSRVKDRRNRRQVGTINDEEGESSTPATTGVIVEQSKIPFPLPGPAGGTAVIDYSVIVSSSPDVAPSEKKAVTFKTIEIRFYPLCLGDNPAGIQGAPVSIDWDHIAEVTTTIDEYETQREQPSRMSFELRMPWELRWYRLCEAGYGESEIMHSIKVADQIRLRRIRTTDTLLLSGIHYFFECLRRGIKNATVRREAKIVEREFEAYWKRVHQQQLEEYGYKL